jgi:hypothetical protein
MAEIVKDFVKFIAEVVALLIIFSVLFGPKGMASNTFNYFTFAEPILIQNYISSAMSIASELPGEYTSVVKLTTDEPHTIRVFFQGGVPYVNVIPAIESFIKTDYATINPTPITTDCTVKEMTVTLPKKSAQKLTVEKYFVGDKCILTLTSGAQAGGSDIKQVTWTLKVESGRGQICAKSSTNAKQCTPNTQIVTFDYGEHVTLSAIPDDDYVFVKFEDKVSNPSDQIHIEYKNPVSFDATDSGTIYAYFSKPQSDTTETIPTCNNDNVADANEECDGSDLKGARCQDLGFSEGTPSCIECVIDTSECTGIIEPPVHSCDHDGELDYDERTGWPIEECDGNAMPIGAKCVEGGILGCTSDCYIDFSRCYQPECGLANSWSGDKPCNWINEDDGDMDPGRCCPLSSITCENDATDGNNGKCVLTGPCYSDYCSGAGYDPGYFDVSISGGTCTELPWHLCPNGCQNGACLP